MDKTLTPKFGAYHSYGIYFIQRGRTGPIKIGQTKTLPQRFRQLQKENAMPLTLLRVIPQHYLGGRSLEAMIHKYFDDFRLGGREWFRPEPQLLDAIERADDFLTYLAERNNSCYN